MTDQELKQTERDAERDAEVFGLVLLLAMRERRGIAAAGNVLFSRSTAQFTVNGRTVAAVNIRRYLQRIKDRSAARIIKITTALEFGHITFEQWKAEFERSIRSIHILAGALALGGIGTALMSQSVKKRIDEQLYFMGKFGGAMQKNQAGTYARIKSRAVQYMRAAHLTYVNVQFEFIKELEIYGEVRNWLQPIEHCFQNPLTGETRTDCPTVTLWGWVPLDKMIPIGKRVCDRYCTCFLEYR